MRSNRETAVEFLKFLAEISDEGTGEIVPARLARYLGMREPELLARWSKRGPDVPWRRFTDELLSVLDVEQQITGSLEETLRWYRCKRLPAFKMITADEVVSSGRAAELVEALQRERVLRQRVS